MALVREGNTARVTMKTPPIAHGNISILFSSSRGLLIVVLSLSISTLASAGIRTAGSLGVILFKNRNIIKVIAVNAAEQAKNMAVAIVVDEAELSETIETTGGNIPDNPCPVIKA